MIQIDRGAEVDLGKMDPCIESLFDRVESQTQTVCFVVW